jgi:NAD(P)H-quinone oxidoreductase subunit 5
VIVWFAWLASLGGLAAHVGLDRTWTWEGIVRLDGLTWLMWTTVTFFSGIVHSYSRRYMAGDRHVERFFGFVFAFTIVVMTLVAADHLVLFGAAWLAMGLIMAELIGHVRGWDEAENSATIARRHFVASSILLAAALAGLGWASGATTLSGIVGATDTLSPQVLWWTSGALILAAMIQSALVPFHTWILSSMTAPTPASALMHAGFVNAGGILLARFAPVVSIDARIMGLIVAIGAISALLGKLLKSVRADVKRQLGCSTVGQMGFMIMQAGLGFFGAALAHLILHGFYKAYLFLSSGECIEHVHPEASEQTRSMGPIGWLVTLVAAAAGGALFALLTGKGTHLDSGILLTFLVVLTTLHATREGIRHVSMSASLRYLAAPLVFLPTVALYAGIYNAITELLSGLPVVTEPMTLSPFHGILVALFTLAYVIVETGLYKKSKRLYVALLNASRPPSGTVLTSKEAYRE